ncbi:hypothetical protein ACFQE1_07480 [Halobium palmae]|uniref:Uncharacterized protein n=1 Tax=Halobium palmae TaxID=1776492 RepID=A0ABD5RY71_9EURY
MTSRNDIERRLDDLDDETDPTVVTLEDVYDWIEALNDGDIRRPPDYFGDDVEWTEPLQETHAMAAGRSPPLELVTPAEAWVFNFMDDDTVAAASEALTEDPPEGFLKAVEATTGPL